MIGLATKAYAPPLPAVSDPFGPDPDDAAAARIRPYTLTDVPREQLYVRRVALANDARDRDYEVIPPEILQRLAATLPGKSVLLHHNKQATPVGLWYHAHVRPSLPHEPGLHTLEAHFFVRKSPENQHLRDQIDAGVVRHTSISFRHADRTCSACGGEYRSCPHLPGEFTSDGFGPITFTYSGDPDRYEATEGSLVHLGAQQGSQIIKSGVRAFGRSGVRAFGRSGVQDDDRGDTMENDKALARIKELESELATAKKAHESQAEAVKSAADVAEALKTATTELESAKQQLATLQAGEEQKQALWSDGQAYRDHLKSEIKRLAGILKCEAEANLLLSMSAGAAAKALKDVHDSYLARVEETFPPRPIGNPASTDKGEGEGSAPTESRTRSPFALL